MSVHERRRRAGRLTPALCYHRWVEDSRERAELLWVRHVLAYMRQTGFDMRPYDRAAVAGLLPNGGG